MSFLFFKNRGQEGKTDHVWGLAEGYKERVNMVEILCTHV
jgi:hypothetical protein